MLGKTNLENQVDKFLSEQAKLEEKCRRIVDLFNAQYSKKEVESFVDYLLKNSANTYNSDLKEFMEHYESNDKSAFTIKDIKTYLTLSKVHKNHMKNSELEENSTSFNTSNQEKNAEGHYE